MTVQTKNFKPYELTCSCCGASGVQQWALDKLQGLRDEVGRPLAITSAYRCANHPNEASKTKPGEHFNGVAFDIHVTNGAERMQIVQLGIKHGAKGIGVANGFVHLDWRDAVVPVMWVY